MCYRKSVSSSSEISRCSFSYYVPVTTASRLPFVGAATSVSTLYSFKECHSPADWRRGHRDHYRYVFVQVRFQWSLESSNGHLSTVSFPTRQIRKGGWGGGRSFTLACFFWFLERTHSLPRKAWIFAHCTQNVFRWGCVPLGSFCPERLICPFLPQNIFQWAD